MEKKLEKDIISCSRCGLCMDVCPVYKAKQTEASVSRGKFLQLLGLIRKDLKYDKNISYNLDLCLACGKCHKACPSNIDAVKIFASAKYEYAFLFEKLYYSAPIFKLKMLALKILYKIKYPLGRKKAKKILSDNKTFHFMGCVQKSIGTGINLKDGKFNCCGLPFYVKGRFDIYEKYKKRNIALIKKYDKVVFDCATCYDTVLGYSELSEKDKEKLIYFTDYYKKMNLSSKKALKITFHKPCHLSEEKFLEIETILSNIQNVKYNPLQKPDECCGFGGDFFSRHAKTASFLSVKKIEDVLKTESDIVLTTCPICLWSLKYGIKYKKSKIKAYDLYDFLSSLTD